MNKTSITALIIGILLAALGVGAFVWNTYYRSAAPVNQPAVNSNLPVVNEPAVNAPAANTPAVQPPLLKTVTDEKQGISYAIPVSSTTTYISLNEPKVTVLSGEFTCKVGKENEYTQTTQETINNRVYCIWFQGDAGMGKTYGSYKYTTLVGRKPMVVAFGSSRSTCENYSLESDERSACLREVADNDVSAMADALADQTVANINFLPKKYTDNKLGITFFYPAELPYNYVTLEELPPKITFINGPYTCAELNVSDKPFTRQEIIGGKTYCITSTTEVGLNNVEHTTYVISSSVADKFVTTRFVVNSADCEGYEQPEGAACVKDMVAFKPELIGSQIIGSVSFK